MRNQRHAVAHGHKALDGFDGGQFDDHVQRRPIALESLNDLQTQRGCDIVGNEVFLAQIVDRDPRLAGHGMVGTDNQCQAVGIDGDGAKLRRIGAEGDDADLEGAQI